MVDNDKKEKDTSKKDKNEEGEDQEEELEDVEVTPDSVVVFSNRGAGNAEGEQVVPLWLITFTDIMALMLTFFVLMYSMSVPQEEKWEEISDSLSKGFSKFYSPAYFAGNLDTLSLEKLDFNDALNLEYLQTILKKSIVNDARLEHVEIIMQQDRLIISLPHDLLFEVGKDAVNADGKKALFALGGILNRISNRIEVVGHSDPQPIRNADGDFINNWALSLSRAAQVSSVLHQVGYRKDVIVRGVSSARYDELPITIPEEERLSLSRRVDIVVMHDDGSDRTFLEFGGSG